MKYDFDQIVDRSGNLSAKYDERLRVFGRADVIPLWVADMDFPSPPEVQQAILARAAEARDVDTKDRYIRKEYFGIMEHLTEIDALLSRHAKGWRTDRLSRISRAVLRLGTYEVVFAEKIPAPVAINEAVELAKKYDDPKARSFINGVLNAIKKELEENGGVLPVAETAPAEIETVEIPVEEPDADPVVEIELTVEDAAEETSEAPADTE